MQWLIHCDSLLWGNFIGEMAICIYSQCCLKKGSADRLPWDKLKVRVRLSPVVIEESEPGFKRGFGLGLVGKIFWNIFYHLWPFWSRYRDSKSIHWLNIMFSTGSENGWFRILFQKNNFQKKNLSPTMVLKFGCHAIMTQNIEWHLNESYNMSNIWSIWLKATILCKAISRW